MSEPGPHDHAAWIDPRYGDPADEGLAAERTELAWSRSGLALMACGVIVAKGLPSISGVPSRPEFGFAILVLGILTWGLGLLASHSRREEPGLGRRAARWRELAPVAFGTAAVGAAGFVLACFQPS